MYQLSVITDSELLGDRYLCTNCQWKQTELLGDICVPTVGENRL